jgi:hypothetical protein
MIVSPNAAQETSVEAIAPGDATQVAEHATRSDSKLMDEAIAPSTSPAQIVVTEPPVEPVDQVGAGDQVEAADHVMIVSPNAAQEALVEAIAPGDATQVAEHATRGDSKLMAIAPSTPPAQIVVTEPPVEAADQVEAVDPVSPNAAQETSIEGVEPNDATQVAEHAARAN